MAMNTKVIRNTIIVTLGFMLIVLVGVFFGFGGQTTAAAETSYSESGNGPSDFLIYETIKAFQIDSSSSFEVYYKDESGKRQYEWIGFDLYSSLNSENGDILNNRSSLRVSCNQKRGDGSIWAEIELSILDNFDDGKIGESFGLRGYVVDSVDVYSIGWDGDGRFPEDYWGRKIGSFTSRSDTATLSYSVNDILEPKNTRIALYYNMRPGTDLPPCSVRFDACVGGVMLPSITVEWGSALSEEQLPQPTRNGYVFNGWLFGIYKKPYTDQAIYEDTTLYASWIRNMFVVNYITGFEDITRSSINVGFGVVLNKKQLPILSHAGYNFNGWLIGGKPYDSDPITEDTDLVADWSILRCAVTFRADGEIFKQFEVDYGTDLAGLLENPEFAHYTVYFIEGVEPEPNEPIIVKNDITVELGYDSTGNDIMDKLRDKWPIVLGGVLGGLAVMCFVGFLLKVISKRYRPGRK